MRKKSSEILAEIAAERRAAGLSDADVIEAQREAEELEAKGEEELAEFQCQLELYNAGDAEAAEWFRRYWARNGAKLDQMHAGYRDAQEGRDR
jgi:hypothetical protein